MATITTEHGTFEAESLKEAQRMERKAAKAAAAQRAIDDANYETARDRAKASGYQILERMVEGESMRRAWHYLTAAECGYLCNPQTSWTGRIWDKVRYETEHGTVEYDHNGYRLLSIVVNGSGWAMLAFLQSDTGSAVECHAVGICEGILAFQAMPSAVKPELFIREPATV